MRWLTALYKPLPRLQMNLRKARTSATNMKPSKAIEEKEAKGQSFNLLTLFL